MQMLPLSLTRWTRAWRGHSLSPELTESRNGLNCPFTACKQWRMATGPISCGRIAKAQDGFAPLNFGASSPDHASFIPSTLAMTCEPLPKREIPNVEPLRSDIELYLLSLPVMTALSNVSERTQYVPEEEQAHG
jgi:hypothetical protein